VTVAITYKLVGTGWAECTVHLNDSHASLTASYLSDALGNLAAAALNLIRGSELERVSFDEEPGEYRWVLKQYRPGELSLRVLEFPELWSEAPDDSGSVLLRGACSTQDFARAVAGGLEAVLAEYGERGYKAKWVEHPFPNAALAALKSELGGRS
jgi:hypothetical protein